ncbi:MAG TPA: flavodoxin-dependent (E)-4-hydroxy-3-methylbut-2-enyl-diphosphate synthase [Acholeplasmataceae bacterium]|jgi:(E)-4-hydroxy-3-methylbut-2-enyl-diphosphate synthase|nr:flavodoxin-dependent (E)-4-hydroxy-3-methylbut-2-enyl-diphosphate synthase [Acholeplasmataceae bacterium]
MSRSNTKKIAIGYVTIGGGEPVAIQSMTTTKTRFVQATVRQIRKLQKEGCQIIRVAVLDRRDAEALGEIKRKIVIPLVADIHFDYRLALAAIEQGVDKIRINPGNIGSRERVRLVVEACQKHKIPIRIGINSGSLEKDLIPLYHKDPAAALIESTRRNIAILEEFGFTDIVLSLKATDPLVTIATYRQAAQLFPYPLHLGLTEAGTAFSGTVRSAAALGILLSEGIGDTIRISLTADPIEEIRAAKELLSTFGLHKKPVLISCPTCGRLQYDMLPIVAKIERYLYQFSDLDIKVAIMGCAVNGPGEAREADIGVAGDGDGALLFSKGEVIGRLKAEEIIPTLKSEIRKLYYSKKDVTFIETLPEKEKKE